MRPRGHITETKKKKGGAINAGGVDKAQEGESVPT